jgi:putative aldouronate transport system permease protein
MVCIILQLDLGPRVKGKMIKKQFVKQWQLQLFIGFGLLYLLIFSWGPLFGWVIAFKDYSIRTGFAGIFSSTWNNFQNFKEFFSYYRFQELLINTISLSLLKLLANFPAAILLALLISEVNNAFFKRLFQTISYLPHFISWVLVYTIAFNLFSENRGIINEIFLRLGFIKQPIQFMSSPNLFYGFTVSLSVWKSAGWSSIIFLAAITSVDQALYESAAVDGAGRLARIWHITLPGMLPAIVTVLIINIGAMLGGGMGGSNFEISQLFSNPGNSSASDIIQTYSFTMGLSKGRFAFSTAVDMCQSFISIVLVVSSNWAAKKISGEGLF